MSSARSSDSADLVSAALEVAAARVLDAVVRVGPAKAVVLVDGRSGSGKTSLARELVARWPVQGQVQLVSLDSLYPGWDGLADGVEAARDLILRPHAKGVVGVWRRWDWKLSMPAEAHAVDPALPLIVEGAGLLTADTARLGDVRVWLESPQASRMRRALDRDGDTFRPHWSRWAQQEDRHLQRNRPAECATHVFPVP